MNESDETIECYQYFTIVSDLVFLYILFYVSLKEISPYLEIRKNTKSIELNTMERFSVVIS